MGFHSVKAWQQIESHGQRYSVSLAVPVQKDAPELLGSFERFWRTSKMSPVERKGTSGTCLAIPFLRYQGREEITNLYSACLPHWGWTEVGQSPEFCQSPEGVQMEVLQCCSPVSLSVMARAGLTRLPYSWFKVNHAHQCYVGVKSCRDLPWCLGWSQETGGRSYGVSYCQITPRKVRREQVRLVLAEGLRKLLQNLSCCPVKGSCQISNSTLYSCFK